MPNPTNMAENYGVEPYTLRCSLISNQAPDHSGIAFLKLLAESKGFGPFPPLQVGEFSKLV